MSDKSNAIKPVYQPSAEKPYFIYSPDGNGFEYFATEKERDDHSESIIRNYLGDDWDAGVLEVIAGKVTSRATEVDVIRPDGKIHEGFDESGEWWGGLNSDDYKCNYKLKPLDHAEQERGKS